MTLTRRGNQAAYEALVARYQARLLAFCRHMLGSREDAEDVLQDVFAAAFNAMIADDRDLNVRPWLYRIARNRCLNHLRRQTAIGVDSMDVHLAEHGTSTADKVHRREEFRELVVDVRGLPESQRTALLLREIDALSYEQIAEAMETTVPSVKSLLVRARVSLAESAEARRLSCDEVRLELGEVAEGLRHSKTPPVRRHVRECERCAEFERHLRRTNKALNAMLPVGPLLLLKKFLVTQAGAGGAASAGAGAGAAAGAAGAAGAGSALTAGVAAVATKTAAGLAAAALVTAGAVEVDHVRRLPAHHPSAIARVAAAPAPPKGIPPVAQIAKIPATVVPHVVGSRPQPTKTVPLKDALPKKGTPTGTLPVAAPVPPVAPPASTPTTDPTLQANGTTTVAQTVTPPAKAPDTGSDVTTLPAEQKPATTPTKDTTTTSTTTASSTTTTTTPATTTTPTTSTTSTTPTTTTTTPTSTSTTPAPAPSPSGGGGTSTTPTSGG